ncbi:MAG TPA: hypothetical protein VFX97_10290 [Pyrinomonadaceae bacterium]|nr:hypothetical protein [Pyrinomonadaceae bacterium]
MWNHRKNLMTRAALFLAVFVITAVAFGQASEQEQRVATLKQAVQQSMAGLRKYEWIETTTVSLKGEVKSQKQNRCYYGADGQIQKVTIGEAAPAQEQSSGRRRGRIKSRIVAKKTGEMTDYMKQAASLVHQYVPPDPALIAYSKNAKKVAVEPVEPNRVFRVSFHDFIKTGDLLSATLNIQSNTILGINVATWLESQKDAITLEVGFSQLPDGTSYSSRTVLNSKAKQITVVVENSGHRALN